jgi:DNA-binding NtrC family response regulator
MTRNTAPNTQALPPDDFVQLTVSDNGCGMDKETLAKRHSDKIHLPMTDMVMPEMNGRKLAGEITELYPNIWLLFMSG